jgi:Peptidase M61 N-terminal domain
MGKAVAIFIALVASMSLQCSSEALPFGAGLYDVAVDSDSLQATVRATLSVTDGQLFTAPKAGGHPWSSYIKGLRAFSSAGKAIRIAFVAPNRWRVSPSTSQTVQIAYDVDLSFTKPVAERSQDGQVFGHELSVINQSLFVMSDALGERTVHFVVPDSFRIACPLRQIAPLTYAAPSNRELESRATVFEWFPHEYPPTENGF